MSGEALSLSHPLVWGMLVYSIFALALAWGLHYARRILMRQTRQLTLERDHALAQIRHAKIQLYEGLDAADAGWEKVKVVLRWLQVFILSSALNRTLYALIPSLRQIALVRMLIPRVVVEGWKRLGSS